MDPRMRKQRSKRKNKATTRYQEEKPTVLEGTPSDDNNIELVEGNDIEQCPKPSKTARSQLGSGHQRASVEDENATTTQSNNEEEEEVDDDDDDEEEEDLDISWSQLFAMQLLSQVKEQDKITEQDIPLLPNPLHKDLLLDRIDIKHFGSETAKPTPSPTNVGPSYRPIGSTGPRPSTFEFGASSQRGMKRALPEVQSLEDNEGQPASRPSPIRAQHFNAPTHAPLTTPVPAPVPAPAPAPAPKRLASPLFPSKHGPQIAPRPFQKLVLVPLSEPVHAPLEEHSDSVRATPILARRRCEKMLDQGKGMQK